jgi:hypothetical protein
MPARKRVWSKLKPEDMDTFLAFLDALPGNERPVYGLSGVKSSFWQKLGSGGKSVVVLFYSDRVVFSRAVRSERPLSDISEIRVVNGPMMSNVEFRFHDGSKTKLANVSHKEAAPASLFTTEGMAAFDRSRLDPETLTHFFYACNVGLPLPRDLFERKQSAI